MPCRRIGRSTSTTPWSKSISITRSAMMHSRPIETCWKAEIVHSWPSTDLAPIETSPSCARILQPCPIHDQRPSVDRRVAADLELHAGADEAQPVGLQPPAPAQLQPQPAQRSAARTRASSMWWRRAKRRNVSGPPCSGGGSARDQRRDRRRCRSGRAARRRTSTRGDRSAAAGIDCSPPMADARRLDLAERLLAGDKRALARAISLVENDDPAGWELVREVYPQHRAGRGDRLHRPARRRQVDAARRADQARARARADRRGAVDRPLARRSPRARCSATGSG